MRLFNKKALYGGWDAINLALPDATLNWVASFFRLPQSMLRDGAVIAIKLHRLKPRMFRIGLQGRSRN